MEREEKMEREEFETESREEVAEIENGNGFEEKKERKIVVPGEILASGANYLPGENAKMEGKDIIATRYGLEDIEGRIVKVIPLSGVYLPRRGNIVVGKVTEITFNGWLIDINCPYPAFLPIMECRGFVNKRDDLSFIYNFDDLIVSKVISVKAKGVDLTMRDRGLFKLKDGITIEVNSNKVPRIIGKKGSMINLIKENTGCDIIVGQNGIIWIKGEAVESELLAKEAINLIVEKSFSEGLTEKIKEFFDKQKKEK